MTIKEGVSEKIWELYGRLPNGVHKLTDGYVKRTLVVKRKYEKFVTDGVAPGKKWIETKKKNTKKYLDDTSERVALFKSVLQPISDRLAPAPRDSSTHIPRAQHSTNPITTKSGKKTPSMPSTKPIIKSVKNSQQVKKKK